jgi:hypothetical protein
MNAGCKTWLHALSADGLEGELGGGEFALVLGGTVEASRVNGMGVVVPCDGETRGTGFMPRVRIGPQKC